MFLGGTIIGMWTEVEDGELNEKNLIGPEDMIAGDEKVLLDT